MFYDLHWKELNQHCRNKKSLKPQPKYQMTSSLDHFASLLLCVWNSSIITLIMSFEPYSIYAKYAYLVKTPWLWSFLVSIKSAIKQTSTLVQTRPQLVNWFRFYSNWKEKIIFCSGSFTLLNTNLKLLEHFLPNVGK